ncbi:pyrroline-5-carboxylate reductase family protein [Diaphorobacter aerolatus]
MTSPGGTTEAAINLLQENGFNSLMERAVHAAALRSAELTFNVSVASSPS